VSCRSPALSRPLNAGDMLSTAGSSCECILLTESAAQRDDASRVQLDEQTTSQYRVPTPVARRVHSSFGPRGSAESLQWSRFCAQLGQMQMRSRASAGTTTSASGEIFTVEHQH
jgi:hypothetical protein